MFIARHGREAGLEAVIPLLPVLTVFDVAILIRALSVIFSRMRFE